MKKVAKTIKIASNPLISLLNFVKMAYKRYGTAVVTQRALADFRDGLKPVHRRILWSFYKQGFNSKGGFKKSAKVVGYCFAAGTPVTLANGDLIPIEELVVGDMVATSQGKREVTQLIENKQTPMFKLDLENGKTLVLSKEQSIKVKIGENFFWKEACNLTPEDDIVVEG